MNEQVREPEWAPETDEANTRNRRGWSIDELRNRLGVAAPQPRETPRKTNDEPAARPRIVRRGMALA
jgi:hypothetical protein